jgi:hypothetical protein
MSLNLLIFLPLLFLMLNHQQPSKPRMEIKKPDAVEVIKLGTGTSFKFKGLAIDVKSQKAFLGSWDKKEIVMVSLLTKKHEILKTKYSGKLNGMDCYLKNGKVYALMNEVDDNPEAQPISVLLIFDSATGKLIRSYEARGVDGRNHFNHVVVSNDGVAYISNTLKSCINIVDTKDPAGRVAILVEHPDLSWVHGIDLSLDDTKLFTTSYQGGIRVLDLKAKSFFSYKDTTLAGDDGLKYHKGSLYGVGQNAIKRYVLDEAETQILKVETILKDHDVFNDPRCLHIENGFLYCLANIEFEPVTFRSGKTARQIALTDTYIIKLKLGD